MTDREFLNIDDDLYALIDTHTYPDTEIISEEYFEVRNRVIAYIDKLRKEKINE